jgi:pyruvate dehydrogenase E2 component (dihydrolipoamide acetyltransferase)
MMSSITQMDVEAFEDGFLAKIVIAEGEMAPVGEAVALIAETEGDIPAVVAKFESGGAGSSASTDAAAPTTASSGAAPAAAAATKPDCEFSQVDMPALSSTMKEGKVVSWLKAEGDPISAGEAIVRVGFLCAQYSGWFSVWYI